MRRITSYNVCYTKLLRYVRHHKEKISDLDGIGRVMPWTMGAFTVAAIGLAGIPPINGFISKWQLGLGSLQAGELLPLAVLVLSGILNAGYFAPVIFRAFLKTPTVPYEQGEAVITSYSIHYTKLYEVRQ